MKTEPLDASQKEFDKFRLTENQFHQNQDYQISAKVTISKTPIMNIKNEPSIESID